MAISTLTSRTLALLARVARGNQHDLATPTLIPRLTIWFSSKPTPAAPALFESKFYLLVQGSKRLVIRGESLDFEAGSCAVSSIGLPFTTEVTQASAKTPYMGVELKFDAGIIASLLLEVHTADGQRSVDGHDVPSFAPAQATDDIIEPFQRLVCLLAIPADIPVLAPQIEREFYYRILQSPMGGTLRQVVQKNTRFDQIRKAVAWVRGNASQPMSVTQLAAFVGMSPTSFHRHFKAVTGLSPLAYQRHIRLLDAQRLIASGTTNVTKAAFATGYASSSQFSREYKRMFGVPPMHDAPAAGR